MKVFNRYNDFVNALNGIGDDEVLFIEKDFNISLTEYTDWDIDLPLKEDLSKYDKLELTLLSDNTKIKTLQTETYFPYFEKERFDEYVEEEIYIDFGEGFDNMTDWSLSSLDIIDGRIYPEVDLWALLINNEIKIPKGNIRITFTLSDDDLYYTGSTLEKSFNIVGMVKETSEIMFDLYNEEIKEPGIYQFELNLEKEVDRLMITSMNIVIDNLIVEDAIDFQLIDENLFPALIDTETEMVLGEGLELKKGTNEINIEIVKDEFFDFSITGFTFEVILSGETGTYIFKDYLSGNTGFISFTGDTEGKHTFYFDVEDDIRGEVDVILRLTNLGIKEIDIAKTNKSEHFGFDKRKKKLLKLKLDKIETKPFIPGNLYLSIGFLKKSTRKENIYRIGQVFKSYSKRQGGFPL